MDKQILVTGGYGFLGDHLVRRLRIDGYKFVNRFHNTEFDLTQQDDVRRIFDYYTPEIVINLAAVIGGIGANQAQPADFLYGNTFMGLELMHQASLYKVEKFIQIGSACIYPKDCPIPSKEEDIWNGYPESTNAPYGIAKRVLLEQAQAYRKQYGFNAIYLIPTNLYGPGDKFDPETSHVIPATILRIQDAIKNNKPYLNVWGTGSATRDFLYVDDCVDGIVRSLEQYDDAEPINLGSGHEITIHDTIGLISDIMGYGGSVVYDPGHPDGQPRRLLDTQHAKEYIGFEAQTPLHTGLKKTVEWWKENQSCGR
jgi:GDP-L-fucose synthase